MRYAFSIAGYVAVVALCMVWAAAGPYGEVISPVALFILAAAHPVVGFAIGRIWALTLVLLLPLLGLPVPTPEDAYEPFPMWFAMLYFGIPIGLVLIGLGLIGRVTWDWRRKPRPA